MSGIQDRRARFTTVIAIRWGAHVDTVSGSIEGIIAEKMCGEGGFGYDPVFIPDGYQMTFAEMSSEEKNAISHRRKAIDRACRVVEGGRSIEILSD